MQNSSYNDVASFERDESMIRPPSPLAVPKDFNPSDVSDEAFAAVADDLINDVILDFCFQVHRASKIGLYRSDRSDEMMGNKVEEDIFGQQSSVHNMNCPHCARKIDASRFAHHLERCMVGNGRKSSRNARRKIDAMGSDYDDENESDSSYSSRKKPKKKTTKGAFRKKVNRDQTMLSIMEASLAQASSVSGSDHMSLDSYKLFFNQYCGVKSKHTKKKCMNSLKCSQHTNEMREDIRRKILASCVSEQKVDDVHIDVDTVDEEVGIFYAAPGISRSSSPEFNSE